MANFDPPSTLKPTQVAVAMIHHGVAKHRTRADVMFFKADCTARTRTSDEQHDVTFGNLCGSLFFATVLTKYTGIISTAPYNEYAVTFALHKAAQPAWHEIFLRGIGCNWLVCVAIWQAAGARETISKVVALWIPIMIFVTCGYDHVVANMFSVPLGILFGADLTVAQYIRKSLIAAYLGNIVGALLVALPALYFYAPDYKPASILQEAEEGEALNNGPGAVDRNGSERSSNDKRGTEVYEVASKRSD
ncbi:hypothetical protein BN946_scf184994.g29 [Trametes cinnabarina]|uniref:Formate/nitrite transporter n=1 Tax=Pycnoporus cinnabarinus TaxID=5643 RepID=A0A060SEZ2_PYCCI|nr:hypothetical protein BN946_scf184994.g29 [Trametes cinnabarina]